MVDRSRDQSACLKLGACSKRGCENDSASRLCESDQRVQRIRCEYWRETQIVCESKGLHELTKTESHRHDGDWIRQCLMDRDRCPAIAL